ncbi:MAG: hypothetical protein LBR53_13165 [Deltaproteobacteria bacterium]|nr:hypothetical protein [Deltaproteobacteria bacterium]
MDFKNILNDVQDLKSDIKILDNKIDSLEKVLKLEISSVESKIDTKINILKDKISTTNGFIIGLAVIIIAEAVSRYFR